MPLPNDTEPKIAEYSYPQRVVSTQWLEDNLHSSNIVVLESNEDILLYDTGHIPGAKKIDWHKDLNNSKIRDYIGSADFSKLCSENGISKDTTVVIYGDKSNWWAAYALWVFTLFGHEDVRLLDGGRDKWIAENREVTKYISEVSISSYPEVSREDAKIRAYKSEVIDSIGKIPLIDVRSPDEYSGKRTHMPDYPQEGALRGGHIPGAVNISWGKAANSDGTFKSLLELQDIYGEQIDSDSDVIAYCRIGERSSHTWFVLSYLLGYKNVRNYDGSWVEWGNAVRVPIARGDLPYDV